MQSLKEKTRFHFISRLTRPLINFLFQKRTEGSIIDEEFQKGCSKNSNKHDSKIAQHKYRQRSSVSVNHRGRDE